MLNPPLSFLSDDLIAYLVDHVSNLADDEALHNLSLADRAFTYFCQTYIFRVFRWDASWRRKHRSRNIEKMSNILSDKPSLANRVRIVELVIAHERNASIFDDGTLITIMKTLAKSPVPPYELHIYGSIYSLPGRATIEDPILVVERLMQSFFSHSLTVLYLSNCKNIPLPLFLVCPRLREVFLNNVKITKESYDEYPVEQCSGREFPSLELLDYRNSQSVVKQMITPPSSFNTPVVLWSKLRVLKLSPHETEEMACLQPILHRACNTLEELHLTSSRVGKHDQLSLAGLVDLSKLSSLRVFALYATIKCSAPGSGVLRDINIVLGTIPASNNVTNLSFDFRICGDQSFAGCLEQDWVGIRNESIRISAGKPLELDLQMGLCIENSRPGQTALFATVMEKTSPSNHPKICTHFWNSTFWRAGRGPFPRKEVHSRCTDKDTCIIS